MIYPQMQDNRSTHDHIVHLHGVNWDDYQHLLAIRGEHSVPRISYIKGDVEFMSPSQDHEDIKSKIGRLIEVYCLERGIPFRSLGSWTLDAEDSSRGVEPDECYIFGAELQPRPHLAIEVIWSSGGINKLELYRKLSIAEVWLWRRGHIQCYVLRGENYVQLNSSAVLPGLDLQLLTSFLDRSTTYDAICGFRAALRT